MKRAPPLNFFCYNEINNALNVKRRGCVVATCVAKLFRIPDQNQNTRMSRKSKLLTLLIANSEGKRLLMVRHLSCKLFTLNISLEFLSEQNLKPLYCICMFSINIARIVNAVHCHS